MFKKKNQPKFVNKNNVNDAPTSVNNLDMQMQANNAYHEQLEQKRHAEILEVAKILNVDPHPSLVASPVPIVRGDSAPFEYYEVSNPLKRVVNELGFDDDVYTEELDPKSKKTKMNKRKQVFNPINQDDLERTYSDGKKRFIILYDKKGNAQYINGPETAEIEDDK